MKATIIRQFESVELEVTSDTILDLKEDGSGKYTLRIASPGARIAVVAVRDISELQLRNLAAEIVRKV